MNEELFEESPGTGRTWKKAGLLALILAGVAIVFFSPVRDLATLEWIRESLSTLRREVGALWWTPFAFVVLFALGALFWAPASVFIVAAAVIWGWKLGGLLSFTGAFIGAILSFEASRWIFGDRIRGMIERKAPRFLSKMENAGIKTVAILRMVPGIPFPLFNYGAGLSSIRTRDYLVGSLLGMGGPIAIIAYSSEAILAGTLDPGQAFARFVQVGGLIALLILLPAILRRLLNFRKDVTNRSEEATP